MKSKIIEEVILVTGPVKSGKSLWAEQISSKSEKVSYIATNNLFTNSPQWAERIKKHKNRRPKSWNLFESPDIVSILNNHDNSTTILIDSLGGLVSHYLKLNNSQWNKISYSILDSIINYKGRIVIVSEEVGWSVSPPTAIGNLFRDRLGELVDNVDKISSDSWLVIHGRAINITSIGLRI